MWPGLAPSGGDGTDPVASEKVFTIVRAVVNMSWQFGRVAELADAKDLGSFGAILAGSIPVAPTNLQLT